MTELASDLADLEAAMAWMHAQASFSLAEFSDALKAELRRRFGDGSLRDETVGSDDDPVPGAIMALFGIPDRSTLSGLCWLSLDPT